MTGYICFSKTFVGLKYVPWRQYILVCYYTNNLKNHISFFYCFFLLAILNSKIKSNQFIIGEITVEQYHQIEKTKQKQTTGEKKYILIFFINKYYAVKFGKKSTKCNCNPKGDCEVTVKSLRVKQPPTDCSGRLSDCYIVTARYTLKGK